MFSMKAPRGGAAPAIGALQGTAMSPSGGAGVEKEVLGEGTADAWGSDRGWGVGPDRAASSQRGGDQPRRGGGAAHHRPAEPLTGPAAAAPSLTGGRVGSNRPTPRVPL